MRQRDHKEAEILIPVAGSGATVPKRCEKVDENMVKDQMVKNMSPARSFLCGINSGRVYEPIGKYQVMNWITAKTVCHGNSDMKLARMKTSQE
jgi:hypothetical protein